MRVSTFSLPAKVFLILLTLFCTAVFAAPGDVDRSFGNNGFIKTPFGVASEKSGSVLQLDGKLIVVGSVFNSGSADFYVIRFNANGSLDTTFDGDGQAIVRVSARDDGARNVAVQPDGKIIVVGHTRDNDGWNDFALVRLNADGSLDTSFDTDGIIIQSNSGYDAAHDVVIQPDGKIIVVGQSAIIGVQHFTLYRYNADGSLDTSFDGDGKVQTQFTEGVSIAHVVELQADGKILAAGPVGVSGDFGQTIFGIARYNPNGSLDTTFAGDGTMTADVGIIPVGRLNSPRAMIIQADNKIVLAGYTSSGAANQFDFAIARFNADGSLDNSFDADGKLVIPFQSSSDNHANTVFQQPDGKLLVAGTARMPGPGDYDSTLIRLNTNGTLDSRFGNNGIAVTRLTGTTESLAQLKLLPDGKIAAFGYTHQEASFARYLMNGAREADFDGDDKTDISIFRPSSGEWWLNRSSSGQTIAAQFGVASDKHVPADFSGDGKTDIAFWRPSSGEWFILRSDDASFYSIPFGAPGDVPAVGDFDADGKADPVIFRPSTNEWFISNSSGGMLITTFGAAGDVPVGADYDGDGKTDIGIFRPSDGSWWYVRSSDNQFRVYSFGVSTDKPVQGDWTGDGKADIAVFRPSTGEWFFQRSEDNTFYSVPFGASGDIPSPGDYDGDGKLDTAVFRPSTASWFVQRSSSGTLITSFGTNGDRPIPNAFIP